MKGPEGLDGPRGMQLICEVKIYKLGEGLRTDCKVTPAVSQTASQIVNENREPLAEEFIKLAKSAFLERSPFGNADSGSDYFEADNEATVWLIQKCLDVD